MAGEELEKTRGQTAAAAEQQEEPTTPTGKMKRTNTIAQTAEVRQGPLCALGHAFPTLLEPWACIRLAIPPFVCFRLDDFKLY